MCMGIPTRIIEICDEQTGRAVVELSRVRREVNIALLLEECPSAELVGQWAIIHAGFAISLVDEDEAAAMLALAAQQEAPL